MTTELTLFEIATRSNFTFPSERGLLSVNDLWTLPLLSKKGPSLNSVAVAISTELDGLGQRTFVSTDTTTPQKKELQQKLDVVLRIIGVREAENAQAAAARQNAARREQLMAALAAKQEQSIQSLSEEEIRAQLASLDATA